MSLVLVLGLVVGVVVAGEARVTSADSVGRRAVAGSVGPASPVDEQGLWSRGGRGLGSRAEGVAVVGLGDQLILQHRLVVLDLHGLELLLQLELLIKDPGLLLHLLGHCGLDYIPPKM